MMKLLRNLFLFLFLCTLSIPVTALAQLSSESFVVEKYSVGGFGQSVDASSTNFGLDLEPGGLYFYDVPTSTPTPTSTPPAAGSSGGGKKRTGETSVTLSATIIGPKQVFVGDSVLLVVEIRDSYGKKVKNGGEEVLLSLSGVNSQSLSVTDNGNGTYGVSYVALNTGIDVITGLLNGDIIVSDSDGVSDGRLYVLVRDRGKPPIPPGQIPRQPEPELEEPPVVPEDPSVLVDYGVTAACNRAFTWNFNVAASIYRTVENAPEKYLLTTDASMPWFVDTEELPKTEMSYLFMFGSQASTTVYFNADDFANCEQSTDDVIATDIDSDNNLEEFVEGIFQDSDGSSRPLATTPDGIVLDTNDDNEPDLFWNPLLGTSTVISAGDRVYIVDQSVAPTQSFLPYIPGTPYRVRLEHAGDGNVALAYEAVALIELTEPLEIPEPPRFPFEEFGLFSGALLMWWRFSRVPFSMGHVWKVVRHGWRNLIELIVFWKKRKPWGTVYDSITKAPVDPAYVEIFDTGGQKLDEAITDLDGRYGFLVPEGSYTMSVRKTHYTFPSKHHPVGHTDILYTNLYFGGEFETSAAVARDIPMDPVEFDWNQFEKMRTHQTKFIHRFDPLLIWMLDIMFWVGAIMMVWQFAVEQSVYSGILLLIYGILLFLRITREKPPLYGTIKRGSIVLPHAIVRILQGQTLISSKVADANGRYVALVAPGDYTIQVEERVGESAYKKVYEKSLTARKGVINKNIRL